MCRVVIASIAAGDHSTSPRSSSFIVWLVRTAWELSGVVVCCGGVLYQRLWRCGYADECPSCVAGSAAVTAGQGRAGMGDGPAHLRCRLLRARLYVT